VYSAEETETMRDEHHASIGSLIAQLREEQGWSQRALAKWVGIDQSAVSRIEAGRRRLSADELQRFADALHVSADVLLKGAGDIPTGEAGPRMPTPPSYRALDEPVAPRQRMAFSRASDDLDEESASSVEPITHALTTGLQAGHVGTVAPDQRASLRGQDEAFAAAIPARSRSSLPARARADRVASAARGTTPARSGLPLIAGLPDDVAGVVRDWFALRGLAQTTAPAQLWSTGHSAEGKPERVAHTTSSLRPGPAAGDVLFDRVARFWRSELHIDPDDGPLPDLVPLLEDGHGAQIVVARVAPSDERPASDRPVAAAFTAGDIPFVFVNAARPVILQRFALAHAFAHLVLGHGDVVDERVEWSRNVPPEAAANDFAEELLAPVRAVQRWYERRGPALRPVDVDDLLALGNAFGISAWSALYRSRAAGRLHAKQFQLLRGELQRHEWEVLPRQEYLGGLRDTLAHLTPGEALPPGEYGGPAVLRVPAAMRAWALAALRSGRLSLEEAAAMLHLETGALAVQLARLGLE
jgi:transcriptional regulator with XRE-family HTH domain/Zn-dependent peptidase ImmA (M78 family)